MAGNARAATYYISPNGNNANAGTSPALAWKTFAYVQANMPGGNTLQLITTTTWPTPTVYSEAAGTGYINANSCAMCGEPPNGTAGAFTVVTATGYVQVKGNTGANNAGLQLGDASTKRQYVKIEKIVFENGGEIYNGSNIWIKDCGFHSAQKTGGTVFGIGTNDGNWGNFDNLVEDSWIWGQERGIGMNYRTTRCVWRRVLLRGDGCNSASCTGSGNPNIGVTVYNSSYTSLQNVLVVDRVLGGGEPYADFANAMHDPGPGSLGAAEYSRENEWLGCISLNGDDSGYYFEVDNAAGTTSHRAYNCVGWDNVAENFNMQGDVTGVDFQNITTGVAGTDNIRIQTTPTPTGTFRNLIAYNATRYGVNSKITPSYSDVFGAVSSAYNTTTCGTGCKTTNPLSDGTPASVQYVPRIESGSTLAGSGFGGGNYGADAWHVYGSTGLFYSDSGSRTQSSTASAFPWPNQTMIYQTMCTEPGITRGFCSDTSVDRYVWNYLGNGLPADYGGTGGGGGGSTPAAISMSFQGIGFVGMGAGR